MHQSFVSMAPNYGDSRGKAGVRTGAGQLLFDCPRSAGEVWGYNIGTLAFCCVGWGKEQGCYHQLVPHRAGLIPGLWKVKTIIPAHPRRWGSSEYK